MSERVGRSQFITLLQWLQVSVTSLLKVSGSDSTDVGNDHLRE